MGNWPQPHDALRVSFGMLCVTPTGSEAEEELDDFTPEESKETETAVKT